MLSILICKGITSEVLYRCICSATPISFGLDFRGVLISLKLRDFWTVHILHHVVGLPLLEAEANTFVCNRLARFCGYLFWTYASNPCICLVFVILHLDEVRINCARVQAKAHERVDCGCLRDAPERPALLILELYQVSVILNDLVSFIFAIIEKLG